MHRVHLYTLHGATMLARGLAAAGNHYCRIWFAEGAGSDYEFADEGPIFADMDFLEWATSVDIEDPCFDRIVEINGWKPERTRL